MKTYLILFIFICSFKVSSQITNSPKIFNPEVDDIKTFTGIEQKLYPDGKLMYWKELTNGKASGNWLEYYPDGTLRYKAMWQDNKGHGKWEYFYPNGNLRSVSVYEKDIPIGIEYQYHENGNLKSEVVYVDGKRNGEVKEYDVNGILTVSQLYKDGVKVLNKPVLFEPEIISTKANNEYSITFEPDGKTLYFCRRVQGKQAQKIYKSVIENNKWKTPEVTSFSTDTDEAPFVTSNGKRMYFASYRKLPNEKKTGFQDMNIWYMDKSEKGWSSPKALANNINKLRQQNQDWPTHYEASPTTDLEGNLYYWTKNTSGKDGDIFTAKLKSDGTFENPEEVPNVNHNGFDSGAIISTNGNYMFIVTYNRYDSYGREDIYYSKKVNGNWTTPVNLGPTINTMYNDVSPSFSPDGKYFFFSSDRANDLDADGERIYSIYYMETQYLQVK
uniref:hypothetical protein n=1 Tax=Flavobacterium sp. TaxID=239 RepID=UPI00404A48CE